MTEPAGFARTPYLSPSQILLAIKNPPNPTPNPTSTRPLLNISRSAKKKPQLPLQPPTNLALRTPKAYPMMGKNSDLSETLERPTGALIGGQIDTIDIEIGGR